MSQSKSITWKDRGLKCGYPGGKRALYGLFIAAIHGRVEICPFTNGMEAPFDDIPVPAECVEALVEALQAGTGGRTLVEYPMLTLFEDVMATGLFVAISENFCIITVQEKRGATKYFLQLPVSALEEIVETLELYGVLVN